MADLIYGVSAFDRRRGDFPQLAVENMLAESVPTEPGTAMQARPGLKNGSIVLGSNASVEGLFKADGIVNSQLFSVSGGALYADSTLVGNIDGSGPVSFDGYSDYVFVNAGSSVWSYDGSTLATVDFPDGADASKILVGASRLVAIRKDTGSFYWTEPLGTTIDGLAFATAENRPDTLKDMVFVGDKLMLFGTETVEFWQVSANGDIPFTPLVGLVYPIGCKGTGCATQFSNTFAWITNRNEVCVKDPENIISDPALQVKIKESTTQKLWRFYIDDNEYLAVSLDNETWVYGARSQVWSTFSSHGYDNWVCQSYSAGFFGTTIDNGVLAEWSDTYDDFGGPVTRKLAAWAPITAGVEFLNNVVLRTNPGTTPNASGLYSEPVVELRTSIDGGKEWMPWIPTSLGPQGGYRTKTIWSSLGQFAYPGVLVEIRCTDGVPFRVSGLVYNEPFAGR